MELKKFVGFLDGTGKLGDGLTIGIDGDCYDVLDFDPEYLTLDRIAHSLSLQCRYLGNTNEFYSVAQHSVRIAEFFLLAGRPDLAKQGLFHDAGETIYGDFSRPIKKHLEKAIPWFKELLDSIDTKIADHFEVKWPMDPDVDFIDKNMARLEITYRMATDFITDYWSPELAKQKWVETYKKVELALDYSADGADYVNQRLYDYE